MAQNYRIIDFRGPGGDPSNIVTKDELFDASTGKIKSELIDASISAEIDLVKVAVDAGTTPEGIEWKKSPTVTVTGTLEASYLTRSHVYLVKDYDLDAYDSYVTAEVGGGYQWERLSNGSFDLDYEIVEEI